MGQSGIKVGYARVSTADQDLQAQLDALGRLGVEERYVFTDKAGGGSTDRDGLRQALAAVREGDTLVVTKLDRLARSIRDAADLADELTNRGVALSLGGSVYDPTDPVGKLLFNTLAMVAEFERDLIRVRTKEGMAVARARGRLKGRQPKLSPAQQRQVTKLLGEGEMTPAEIGELFGVSRQTVYRVAAKQKAAAA